MPIIIMLSTNFKNHYQTLSSILKSSIVISSTEIVSCVSSLINSVERGSTLSVLTISRDSASSSSQCPLFTWRGSSKVLISSSVTITIKYVKGFYGSNGVTSFSVAIIFTLYRDNKGYIWKVFDQI